MLKYYVSHPYTGNEEYNKKEAEVFTTLLAREFPNTLFINPLSALAHTANVPLTYDIVLEQCIELLDICDGIIMTGEWKDSCGCKVEYDYAIQNNMQIYSLRDFIKF